MSNLLWWANFSLLLSFRLTTKGGFMQRKTRGWQKASGLWEQLPCDTTLPGFRLLCSQPSKPNLSPPPLPSLKAATPSSSHLLTHSKSRGTLSSQRRKGDGIQTHWLCVSVGFLCMCYHRNHCHIESTLGLTPSWHTDVTKWVFTTWCPSVLPSFDWDSSILHIKQVFFVQLWQLSPFIYILPLWLSKKKNTVSLLRWQGVRPLLFVLASSSLIITQESTEIFSHWQAVWERKRTGQADRSYDRIRK